MTTLHRTLLGGLLAFGVLAVAPAEARPGWVSGTWVYADLCTSPEDGAQAGRRITLKRSPNGDGLIYEGAGLRVPVLTTVTVDDATKDVAFRVETEAGLVSFHGTAGPEALVGTLDSAAGSQPVRLKRVLRSRAHEACPGETTGSIN
ncbi:hypothetical protein ASG52_07090 [Methylobacterium sp. Leaf456]|uniref:hypothetical protein n=1 Tax=Methylobacterium sp. Leaf456 TaxID=1736382 RepID=UPI0006FF027D|nr:hypothetical protein [Methylobacterium sp. Leaf456]KQT50568.1 hypothetical protein ASG52_07090 [Methylobacterium sp. Leaf456]